MAVGFLLVLAVIAFFLVKNSLNGRESEIAAVEAEGERTVDVPAMSAEDALRSIVSSHPPKILDVRNETEYLALHIPDSVPVTPDLIPGLPFRESDEVILIASDADVAALASEALSDLGIPHHLIEGGLPAWETIGGALVTYGNPSSTDDQSKVTMLTKDEFLALFGSGAIRYRILDIRSDGTPLSDDAIHIPFEQLESRRHEIPSATSLALCGDNGLQAFQAAVRLFDLGFVSVRTLDGNCQDLVSAATE